MSTKIIAVLPIALGAVVDPSRLRRLVTDSSTSLTNRRSAPTSRSAITAKLNHSGLTKVDNRHCTVMSKKKKQRTTEYIYTQVVPVVSCSDVPQVTKIMHLCGTARALTYNKLGSLQGWGLDWKKADPIVRTILKPTDIGLPAKLWEWSVNDTFKAISAQQEASITWLIRNIYQKVKEKDKRKRLIDFLKNNPTADNWLHRSFRQQYLKGHTFGFYQNYHVNVSQVTK